MHGFAFDLAAYVMFGIEYHRLVKTELATS